MKIDRASSPKLTIAIPSYKATFFNAALESAVYQNFDNFEILICDDCRTDAIKKIVSPYLKNVRGPKIRYVWNQEQLGGVKNFGKCIELAEGEFFKFLCDDDILLPGSVAAQAKILEEFPGVSLVSSHRKIIDEMGADLPDSGAFLRLFKGDFFINGPDLVSFLADYTLNFIGEPPCVMCRREQLLPEANEWASLGGTLMPWLGDLAMYAKLLRSGDLVMLENTGACFRFSTEQASNISRNNPNIGDETYKNFGEKIRTLGWYRSEENHLVRMAPLEMPMNFKEVDLLERVKTMLRGHETNAYLVDEPVSLYANWVLSNRMQAGQQIFFPQRNFTEHSTNISVLVALNGNAISIEKTRASLVSQFDCVNSVIEIAPDFSITTQLEQLPQGWVILLSAGDTLEPDAVLLLRHALNEKDSTHAVVVYFDHDETGSLDIYNSPHCKPSFNEELLCSYPYMGRALAVRADWAKTLLEKARGVLNLSCAYRLMLAALRDAGSKGFIHG